MLSFLLFVQILVSNPDPTLEEADVPGALNVWKHLNDADPTGHFKLWKVSETRSLDVSGNEEPHFDYAKVYGVGIAEGEVPKLKINGLRWKSADPGRSDLYAEAYDRIMERSEVDRWYDACLLALSITIFTCIFYATCRYSESINSIYPKSVSQVYILDKAIAWTALWMMIVSPFAGNLLVIRTIWMHWSKTCTLDKMVWVFSVVIMAFPTIYYACSWTIWFILRNSFSNFCLGRRPRFLYLSQGKSNPDKRSMLCPEKDASIHTKFAQKATSQNMRSRLCPEKGETSSIMAMLVDKVSLKGETGVVGFVFALAHSFRGFIMANPTYKVAWFDDKETGRLLWNIEVFLMTGCIATALLFCVALRSLFGKASWIRLKPIYAYLCPLGIWLAVIHVVMYAYISWKKM